MKLSEKKKQNKCLCTSQFSMRCIFTIKPHNFFQYGNKFASNEWQKKKTTLFCLTEWKIDKKNIYKCIFFFLCVSLFSSLSCTRYDKLSILAAKANAFRYHCLVVHTVRGGVVSFKMSLYLCTYNYKTNSAQFLFHYLISLKYVNCKSFAMQARCVCELFRWCARSCAFHLFLFHWIALCEQIWSFN